MRFLFPLSFLASFNVVYGYLHSLEIHFFYNNRLELRTAYKKELFEEMMPMVETMIQDVRQERNEKEIVILHLPYTRKSILTVLEKRKPQSIEDEDVLEVIKLLDFVDCRSDYVKEVVSTLRKRFQRAMGLGMELPFHSNEIPNTLWNGVYEEFDGYLLMQLMIHEGFECEYEWKKSNHVILKSVQKCANAFQSFPLTYLLQRKELTLSVKDKEDGVLFFRNWKQFAFTLDFRGWNGDRKRRRRLIKEFNRSPEVKTTLLLFHLDEESLLLLQHVCKSIKYAAMRITGTKLSEKEIQVMKECLQNYMVKQVSFTIEESSVPLLHDFFTAVKDSHLERLSVKLHTEDDEEEEDDEVDADDEVEEYYFHTSSEEMQRIFQSYPNVQFDFILPLNLTFFHCDFLGFFSPATVQQMVKLTQFTWVEDFIEDERLLLSSTMKELTIVMNTKDGFDRLMNILPLTQVKILKMKMESIPSSSIFDRLTEILPLFPLQELHLLEVGLSNDPECIAFLEALSLSTIQKLVVNDVAFKNSPLFPIISRSNLTELVLNNPNHLYPSYCRDLAKALIGSKIQKLAIRRSLFDFQCLEQILTLTPELPLRSLDVTDTHVAYFALSPLFENLETSLLSEINLTKSLWRDTPSHYLQDIYYAASRAGVRIIR